MSINITGTSDPSQLVKALKAGQTKVDQLNRNLILPESKETRTEQAKLLARDIAALSQVTGGTILSKADRQFAVELQKKIEGGGAPSKADLVKLKGIVNHAIKFLSQDQGLKLVKADHKQDIPWDKQADTVLDKFEAFQDWIGLQGDALKTLKSADQIKDFKAQFNATVENMGKALDDLKMRGQSRHFEELIDKQIERFEKMGTPQDLNKLRKSLEKDAAKGVISRAEMETLLDVSAAIDKSVAGCKKAMGTQEARFRDLVWSGKNPPGTMTQAIEAYTNALIKAVNFESDGNIPSLLAPVGLDKRSQWQAIGKEIGKAKTPGEAEVLYNKIQGERQALIDGINGLNGRYIQSGAPPVVARWLDIQSQKLMGTFPSDKEMPKDLLKLEKETLKEMEREVKAGRLSKQDFQLLSSELRQTVDNNISGYRTAYKSLADHETKLMQKAGPKDQEAYKLNRDLRLAKAKVAQLDVGQRLLDFAMMDGKLDGEGYMKAKDKLVADFKPHYAALRVIQQKMLQQDFARLTGAAKDAQGAILGRDELKELGAGELVNRWTENKQQLQKLIDDLSGTLTRFGHDDTEGMGVGRRGTTGLMEALCDRLKGAPDWQEKEKRGLDGIQYHVDTSFITSGEADFLRGIKGSVDKVNAEIEKLRKYQAELDKEVYARANETEPELTRKVQEAQKLVQEGLKAEKTVLTKSLPEIANWLEKQEQAYVNLESTTKALIAVLKQKQATTRDKEEAVDLGQQIEALEKQAMTGYSKSGKMTEARNRIVSVTMDIKELGGELLKKHPKLGSDLESWLNERIALLPRESMAQLIDNYGLLGPFVGRLPQANLSSEQVQQMLDDELPKLLEEGKQAKYSDEWASAVQLKMDKLILAKLDAKDSYQYLGRIFFGDRRLTGLPEDIRVLAEDARTDKELSSEELQKRNALLLKALPFLYADRWANVEDAIKQARA